MLAGAEKHWQYLMPGPVLKKNHSHYFQIQTLLGMMKMLYAKLVIWCPKDIIVIQVEANPNFYKGLEQYCVSYYTMDPEYYKHHLWGHLKQCGDT